MPESNHCLAILYADICDSVRLYERLGDAEAHRLAERSMHSMAEITQQYGGTLIRTQGDGVMSTLPSATAACYAARSMQQAHQNGPVGIRIGFNYGAVIESDGDVYGDAVNLAARVSALARSGEILTTEETLGNLAPEQRASMQLLDQTTVKGKSEQVRIYSLVNKTDGQATALFQLDSTQPNLSLQTTLTLRHGDRRIELQNPTPPLVMGRSPECQLVVDHNLVSRRHAVIEPRRDHFVISDQSTNGTFVETRHGEKFYLKRESARLVGSGHISLGKAPDDETDDVILYSLGASE